MPMNAPQSLSNQEIYALELPESLRDKMRAAIMAKCRCCKPGK